MVDISVSYSATGDFGDIIEGAIRAISSVLSDLDTSIAGVREELVGNSWSEYFTTQSKCNGVLDDMGMKLASHHANLQTIVDNYQRTDRSLAANWGDLGSLR